MSSFKELGGCLWKLFQLGIVVAILGLGFMFIAKPQAKEEELETTELDKGEKAEGSDTGLVAKVKRLFGGDEKKTVEMAHGSTKDRGGTRNRLETAQKDVGKGHVDLKKLLEMMDDEDVKKEIEMLAEGTTQIEQILFWQIYDGKVYYRIVLRPYDRKAHELMMQPGEALFMSFLSEADVRLVPKSADYRIDMRYLRVATEKGYAVGWFYDGVLPLAGVEPEAVDHGSVGWIFSAGLHARLRQIQAPRKPAGKEVSKPFSIDIPVDEQGRPKGP